MKTKLEDTELKKRLASIRILSCDVDGVLTGRGSLLRRKRTVTAALQCTGWHGAQASHETLASLFV